MPKDLPGIAPGVRGPSAAEPHDETPSQTCCFSQLTEAGSVDWADAVDAAAARLIESWVSPDTTDHMVASGLADEFAATLCAYGMAPAEVAHYVNGHPDDPLGGQGRAAEECHVTPAGAPRKPPA